LMPRQRAKAKIEANLAQIDSHCREIVIVYDCRPGRSRIRKVLWARTRTGYDGRVV
jgi:hypothetical protein